MSVDALQGLAFGWCFLNNVLAHPRVHRQDRGVEDECIRACRRRLSPQALLFTQGVQWMAESSADGVAVLQAQYLTRRRRDEFSQRVV